MCDCGCNICEDKKPVMLNENLASKEILSEGLKYHMDNNRPLTEHVYRAGSEKYFNLWAEARALYTRGILEVQGDDLEVLTETDLGHTAIVEGVKVPLDFPIELNELETEEFLAAVEDEFDKETLELMKQVIDKRLGFLNTALDISNPRNVVKGYRGHLTEDQIKTIYEEAKKKIGKPMRSSSGGKAYKVYVRDPKTKKIKTVRFGSGGLKAKINNPKARQAFAKRHDCANKKDKTKASYWSCRLPRYAKLLGLKSSFSGFW